MPSGGKNQLFYKKSILGIALNRVLTPAVARSRRELSESSGIIEKDASCVELDRFKSCFDTGSVKISTRAFRIRIQISKRSIVRRVMVTLLKEKNFGPNVIYYVFVTPLNL